MAYPSVTYTFTNGTTASATEVNQNFTDLINGLSDGTKDISISALTVAGTASLNGAVNIGNATSDDIAVNGYITTALIPKADDSYDLGTAALAWQDGYFDGRVYTDTISELTSAAGVTIDGVLLKDGGINFGDESLSEYDEGTFTATLTGCTTSPTANVTYVKVGRMVTISIPTLTGTSNTTACTLTGMPAALYAAVANVSQHARVIDNGNNVTTGVMIMGATGTITMFTTAAGGAFTNSGTKGVDAVSITYATAS